MTKVKIELKKPQYLMPKETPKPAPKKEAKPRKTGLPGFYKFLLFLSFILLGFALWVIAPFFIEGVPVLDLPPLDLFK